MGTYKHADFVEAKSLFMRERNGTPREELLEELRVKLVNAMRHGLTLYVRTTNTALSTSTTAATRGRSMSSTRRRSQRSRRWNQLKKTTYAQTAQIKAIRKRMTDIMTKEASTVELKDLVRKFIPNSIGTQIEQACQSIYPLKDVYIRKVKTLKAPKFDITKLMEVHGNASESSSAPVPGQDEGTKLDRPNDGL